MAKVKVTTTSDKHRTAINPDNRELQLVALATDLAEQQLRDGTASSQVITHYLKLATAKERLERDILEENKKLLAAKTKSLEDMADMKELYANAIAAMRRYGGHGGIEDDGSEEY